MKILHVISGLTVGGAEMSLYRLARELRRSGVESVVVCLGRKGGVAPLLEEEGFEVRYLGLKKNLLLPFRFLRLVPVLRKVRPDAVQGWMYPGNLAASLAVFCAGRRLPVYWNIRQSLYSLRDEKPFMALLIRIDRWLSRAPARIVYNSRAGARQHEAFGYAPEKTVVIPNGFDAEVFQPLPAAARRAARAELSLPAESLLIGLVGRDHPKKDRATFMEAVALSAWDLPDAHYLLVGRNMDAPDHPLRLRARALNLEGRFTFAGERADVREWIAVLDVAVSSSFAEGFPNVVGEAMACEVPCIATDVGDTAFLLGDAGLLVPPRDAAALARAMTRMAALEPARRAEMGAGGRRRIRGLFSLERAASSYGALYARGASADNFSAASR